jgi:hypothetical protein
MWACLLAVAFGQRTLQQVSGTWRVGPGKEPAEWSSSQGEPLVPFVLGELKGAEQAFVHIDAENRLHIDAGAASGGSIASAKYKDTIEEVGWAYLHVSTTEGSAANDDLAMYAAGLLEGALSRKRISQFHHNANKGMQGMEDSHHARANMAKLFATETSTLRTKVGLPVDKDWQEEPKEVFDRYVRNVFLQTWGVLDGYNAATTDPDDKMSLVDLFILNSDGETPELEMALDMEESLLRQSTREDPTVAAELSFLQRPSPRAMRRKEELQALTPAKWRDIKRTSGRCSALVRLADNNTDLYVGHATFSDFSEMLRVFKYYDFPLKQGGGARTVGFSSYPGAVSSTDDYYVTSNQLLVTETTISLLTDEPYDHLDDTGKALPDFIRIMASTFAAGSGEDWVNMMTGSATGLYGSQWMVVDYKKFTPGKPVPDGTLFVLEQVPDVNHNSDMSDQLNKNRFWSSENRAFFPDARQVSGFAEAEEMHGALFSADHNPRANIFAATEKTVNTLGDFRAEMRRNRWPHEVDGGPENTPDHAISARSDLAKENAAPNGGVDAKVAGSCMVKNMKIDAICGPTEDQGVFSWTDPSTHKELWPDAPHEGLPDSFNFPWVRMNPTGFDVQKDAGSGC